MKFLRNIVIIVFLCFLLSLCITVNAETIEEQNTHKYTFYNGNNIHYEVILKGEEVLSKPANPTQDKKEFLGWYIDTSFNQEFNGFGNTPSLDNGETKLYAKFKNVFYIMYLDIDNNVITTNKLDENSSYTIKPNEPVFVIDNPKQKMFGWKDQYGNEYKNEQNITVNKDITLTPILKEGVYVRFHTDGGTPIGSQFIDLNDKVVKPVNPTKKGYAFDKWYKDTNFSEEFDFNSDLSSDVDIYAKWNPAQTEYTLVFYVQNGSNDNYSFYTSRQVTGITGESVQLSTVERNYINSATKVDGYTRYFINEDKLTEEIIASGTIKSDGSTVLNVYLDRVYYYIRFQNVDYRLKWGQPLKPLLDEPGFSNYQGTSQFRLTYNGKYLFNIKPNRNYSLENPSQFAKQYGSEIPIGAILNATYNGSYEGPYRLRQYHYRETLDSTEDNKIYIEEITEHTHVNQNATYVPSDSSKWKIVDTEYHSYQIEAGYLGVGTDDDGTYRYLKIWYDRQLYDLTFIGTSTKVINDIMWGKNISSFAPLETTMIRDGITYKFAGWFKDEACLDRFDLENNVMTDRDLTLYAKWEELKSKVTFEPNFGTNTGTFSSSTEVIVNTGKKVEEPVKPVRNTNSDDNFNYVFLGWSLNGNPYDFNSPVTEDITLVAVWGIEPIPIYRVIYNSGNGSGSILDNNKYLSSSKAKVLFGNTLIAPVNSRFIYWQNGGSIYYPNDLINIINQDIVLSAVYQTIEKTSLVYDLNYKTYGLNAPKGVNSVDGESAKDLMINSTITLREIRKNEIPKGYTFKGWCLDKNCSSGLLTKVIIDNNNPMPNVVYAMWEKYSGDLTIKKETIDNISGSFDFGIKVWKTDDATVQLDLSSKFGNPNSQGYYEFTLQNDKNIVIQIPYGYSYEVFEKTQKKWKLKSINGDLLKTKAEGSISELSDDVIITFLNELITYDLTLKKIVKGDMADVNKEFEFQITIYDGNNLVDENFIIEKNNTIIEIKNGDSIKLKHGETAIIKNLTTDYRYIIAEADTEYDESYKIIDSDNNIMKDTTAGLNAEGIMNKTQTVEFTNVKKLQNSSDIPQTGDNMMINVFMLLISLSGLCGGILYINKNKLFNR